MDVEALQVVASRLGEAAVDPSLGLVSCSVSRRAWALSAPFCFKRACRQKTSFGVLIGAHA